MKKFNTFLNEQKELLTEKTSKTGMRYTEKGGFAGHGHGEPEQTFVNPHSSPMFRELQVYPNAVWAFEQIFGTGELAGLWTNTIHPNEAKRLRRVFEQLPDGPHKQKVAAQIQSLATMSFSVDKEVAMNKLVAELRKNTFSKEPPAVSYKSYTPYKDVFEPGKQTRF